MEQKIENEGEGVEGTKVILFHVGMTCDGCSGAVKRILGKFEGVTSIDANMETNVVTVRCQEEINEQDLLTALQKWSTASGKSVALIEQ